MGYIRGQRPYVLQFKLHKEDKEWDEIGLYACSKADAILKATRKLTDEHGFDPFKVRPFLCCNRAHDTTWRQR